MEPITAVRAYEEYHRMAKFISWQFGPGATDLDAQAWSQSDFVQELRLHAIEVAGIFQKRFGFCLPAERRYVSRSLWRRAYNWNRDAKRKRLPERDGMDPDEIAVDPNLDAAIEAQRGASDLVGYFAPEEKSIFARLWAADGISQQAWQITDGDKRSFRRRVAKLRKKAKNLLGD